MFEDPEEEGRPSNEPPVERPMTLPLAVLWSFLATSLTIILLYVTQSLRPGAATDLVNGLACTAVAYLLCIFLMARTHARQMQLGDLLAIRKTHPLLYVLAAAIGLSLQIPAEIVRRAVERRWPTPPEIILDQLATFRIDSSGRRILVPLIVAALGPLIEEMFFRGALQRGLRKLHTDARVIPVVALLFAVGHVDPRSMLPIFMIGMFLSLLRSASGSLMPSLIAHMAFNGVVVFELVRGTINLEPETTPLPLPLAAAGLAGTLLFTAAFIWVAARSETALRARQEDLT